MSEAAHVDAYLEYRNLVGETDGGVMLSEKEFAKIKQLAAKAKLNELHVSFVNSRGVACRNIGPQSKCFCNHRYRDHNWFDTEGKKVHCRVPGCRCNLFEHMPVMGNQDVKCSMCKHSYTEHDRNSRKCKGCRVNCTQFIAAYKCACGESYENHDTVIENRREREAKGLPVAAIQGGLVPTGGMSSMVDLVDGVDKEELFSHQSLPDAMRALALGDAPRAKHLALAGPAAAKAAPGGASQGAAVDLSNLMRTPHRWGGMGADAPRSLRSGVKSASAPPTSSRPGLARAIAAPPPAQEPPRPSADLGRGPGGTLPPSRRRPSMGPTGGGVRAGGYPADRASNVADMAGVYGDLAGDDSGYGARSGLRSGGGMGGPAAGPASRTGLGSAGRSRSLANAGGGIMSGRVGTPSDQPRSSGYVPGSFGGAAAVRGSAGVSGVAPTFRAKAKSYRLG